MKRPFAILAILMLAAPALRADEPVKSPVKVERVEPERPKRPTLRFLKQNVDFLRGQLDWLVEVPRDGSGDASGLDARWLRYREMMAASRTDRDTLGAIRLAQEQARLLERISDLAALEARLDAMDAMLAAQETRLAWLDEDFTGRQETALIVIARSLAPDAAPEALRFVDEDGDAHTVALTEDHVETLRAGGMAQLLHDFVEPREQVWEVSVLGAGWASHIPVYVTFVPERDQLSFLELDLAHLTRAGGALGLDASIWVHGRSSDTHDWRWASR